MQIGGLEVKTASESAITRLTSLIWAPPGWAKTTLACTAPGKKLLVNIDPDGAASVGMRDDVDVIDLASLDADEIGKKLCSYTNPLDLDSVFKSNLNSYDTIILDSVTLLSQHMLELAVREGHGKSPKFTPTMEAPGLTGYGARNAKVLKVLKGFLRITGKYNKHFIAIAHEADPEKDDKGNVLYISIALGGSLVTGFAPSFSEIWYLQDTGSHFRIAIRPCRSRKPMKTRMFVTDSDPEFSFDFDNEKWDSPSENPISLWWKAFEKSGGKKIPLPKLR